MTVSQVPADFGVVYTWCAASVPPPDHTEYQITLNAAGQGEVIFWPDYPTSQTPCWREGFTCAPEVVQALYTLILEQGLLSRKWRKPRRQPVGGEQAWCQITTSGQTCRIPAELTEPDSLRAGLLYRKVGSLVPAELWARLRLMAERYHQPREV